MDVLRTVVIGVALGAFGKVDIFAGNATAAERAAYRITVGHSKRKVPSPHMGAAAAFDTKRRQMIVFGGVNPGAENEPAALTTYDPRTDRFATIETKGLSPRGVAYPSLVYDSKRDALFLFGGWPKNGDRPTDELWTLRLDNGERATWKLLASGRETPPPRNGSVMVLDADRDRLLLHGGDGGPHPTYGYTPLDDLWSYDLTAGRWSRLDSKGTPPEPRWNHCGAIDPDSDRMFVFGGSGYTASNGLVRDNDIFVLDMKSLVWTRKKCSAPCPTPIQGGTLSFDSQANALVLVGGLTTVDTGASGSTSVWVYDLSTAAWFEQQRILRKTRRGHTAVYDPHGKQHIVHGGQTTSLRRNHYERGQPLYDTLLISVIRNN